MDKWRNSSFDSQDEEPLGPLANLVDIMLVFACGLMAALVAVSPELKHHFQLQGDTEIQQGKELPEVPGSLQHKLQGGDGFQSMGQVYKDPETGKLILISQ